jgi:tRNA G18 (ribose-2'-O)-methylase SpoU
MAERFCVIVHNVRSAYNVGSIFRTADGLGAEKVYLTGYSPAPYSPDRLLKTAAEKMIEKTALGAEKNVPWERKALVGPLLGKLKKAGFLVVALEQDETSVKYDEFRSSKPVALIVGNEPKGIDRKILKKCDAIIEIPMYGQKNSLNVAVAFGIAGYGIRSRIKTKVK